MAHSRQSLLRDRYVASTGTNLFFTIVMAVAMVGLFWGESPTGPLIIWGLILSAVSPIAHFARRSNLEFDRWYRVEIAVQMSSGIAWALIAIIAMPADDVHSALLVAILSSVAVASSAGESQFLGLYLSFLIPFSALILFGYFVFPGGVAVGGVLFLIAICFAASTARDDRKLHHRFVDVVLENNELVEKLQQEHDALTAANAKLDVLAWTDSLTGLANRAAMSKSLERMVADSSTPVTIAYLDLNGFKAVNDTHGHRVGDLLLVEVARRLRDVTRDGELACRQGGDELTVLSTQTDLAELGERLSSLFDERFEVEGHELEVSAAIGLATTDERDLAEELLRRADQALYRHKRNPRGERFSVWSHSPLESIERDAA